MNALLLVAAFASSQMAEVRYADGSVVVVSVKQQDLEVKTKYGTLTVPFSDIERIEVGLHVDAKVAEAIAQHIKDLDAPEFKKRDQAVSGLIAIGPHAYRLLEGHKGSGESMKRAAMARDAIAEDSSPSSLSRPINDTIHAKEFTVSGRITIPQIKASSKNFGDIQIKLPDVWIITSVTQLGSKLTVVPQDNTWFDTGIIVNAERSIQVSADGQVDLWPAGPGQYVIGPKGYTAIGKDSKFMAGALIAKVGDGQPWVVGDHYEGRPAGHGRLMFMIVPSPWNNPSTGSYSVRVRHAFR